MGLFDIFFGKKESTTIIKYFSLILVFLFFSSCGDQTVGEIYEDELKMVRYIETDALKWLDSPSEIKEETKTKKGYTHYKKLRKHSFEFDRSYEELVELVQSKLDRLASLKITYNGNPEAVNKFEELENTMKHP
jgi:hypothetical protein